MEFYSYMCGECFQVYDTIDTFKKHVCHSDVESICEHEGKPILSAQKGKVPDGDEDTQDNEDGKGEETQGDDEGKDGALKKRKKYQAMDDTYRLNRTMRDKDFKLNRSHFYCFKDTLGDWDERSTQFLIQLIHKYPKTHFLLPIKTEKRMGHWENLHREMETAGYTFTVLQLRMRWREVLQKYRWTVDYNDCHEVKKKCEYFDEMNELFGDWDKDATHSLLKQMHRVKLENQKNKIIRIGYSGWEKITENLNSEGHRFTINMVEGRWRNMVTMYKTTVDYNFIPNVEPRSMAYRKDLEELVKYVPQRRQYYEKHKGRSVKMERFPTNGARSLLEAYKECVSRFIDPAIDNRVLWDEITQKVENDGFSFTTFKLKEILNGMIKGFEKCQYHNSLPGAIRRDVPFYRDLAEIYGVYNRWPHIQISRTMEMRTKRKFRLRLQASQQLWSSDESRALLQVYPDVLESHVSQNVNYHTSDLWLQVAKAYAATGYPKRDVPEIAIHFGLLRQGYSQGNLFPFIEEMQRVKETEEAVCYSPDVSKFTGDVEIIYWNHEAVNHLLDLYLIYQPTASSSHGCKDEVFMKIKDKMLELGYGYTKDQVFEQFKTLLTQYNTRKTKPWMAPATSRKIHNPVAAPYWGKLHKVLELRKMMSLSWTTGVKPLTLQAQKIVFCVAYQKAEELLKKKMAAREHARLIAQIIEGIRVHIRTNRLLNPVPRTRQVRFHLIQAVKTFDKINEENKDIICLHMLLEKCDMLKYFNDLSLEPTNTISTANCSRARRKCLPKNKESIRTNGQQTNKKCAVEDTKEDFTDSDDLGWISEEESVDNLNNQEKEDCDTAAEYLAFALTCLKENWNERKYSNIQEQKREIIEMHQNGENNDKINLYNSKCSRDLKCELQLTPKSKFKKNDNPKIYGLSEKQSMHSFSLKRKKVNKSALSYTDYSITQISNVGSVLDQSVPSCSNINWNDTKFDNIKNNSDVYKDLFGETCNITPKRCSSDSKGAFYTFSENLNSNLVLYLPQEVSLSGHCNIYKKDSHNHHTSLNQKKRKLQLDKDSLMTSDSEIDMTNEDFCSSEADEYCHSSQSSKIKGDPETKVIQTRSGRKTRFTYFSKALNYNSDECAEEESLLNSTIVSVPQKRQKLNLLPTLELVTPKRKQLRSQRNRGAATILNCKSIETGSFASHSDSPESSNLENKDKIFKYINDEKNSVLSFFKEHKTERVKTEEQLLSVLNIQQVEQASVITEMIDVFKELQCKFKFQR